MSEEEECYHCFPWFLQFYYDVDVSKQNFFFYFFCVLYILYYIYYNFWFSFHSFLLIIFLPRIKNIIIFFSLRLMFILFVCIHSCGGNVTTRKIKKTNKISKNKINNNMKYTCFKNRENFTHTQNQHFVRVFSFSWNSTLGWRFQWQLHQHPLLSTPLLVDPVVFIALVALIVSLIWQTVVH